MVISVENIKINRTVHSPQVGILILNYHEPEVTIACVRRLLDREGPGARILWIENDAGTTMEETIACLTASGLPWVHIDPDGHQLPPEGHVGFVPVLENLGYAGGNNVGARICHRAGVPYLWVLNNDTLLEHGTSADLVQIAKMRPEIGVWGTIIRSREGEIYSGGTLRLRDFSIAYVHQAEIMETDPLAFVSGCSLFFKTEIGSTIGFLPEEYFLYYEDPAFTLELRRKGHMASIQPEVEIFHEDSFTIGRRSPLMDFYSRRNRWYLIERYFPEHLARQKWLFLYRLQNLLFRGKPVRAWQEWLALRDWKAGRMGRTLRKL